MGKRSEIITQAFNHLLSSGVISKKKDVALAMKGKRPETVSRALNGNKDYLTDQFMIDFDKAFPGIFNLSWLLTGEGSMLVEKKPTQDHPTDNAIMLQLLKMMEQRDERITRLEDEMIAIRSTLAKLERAKYGYASIAADGGK